MCELRGAVCDVRRVRRQDCGVQVKGDAVTQPAMHSVGMIEGLDAVETGLEFSVLVRRPDFVRSAIAGFGRSICYG